MNFVNYIPCKSHSMRIPGKNLKAYGKKSLLDYTVDFSRQTKRETLLSSDLANLSQFYPDVIFHHRIGNAKDFSKTNLDVIRIVLSETNVRYDFLVLLQITHPVRSLEYYNRLIGVCEIENPSIPIISITEKQDDNKLLQRNEYRNINGNFYVLPKDFVQSQSDITEFVGFFCEDKNINIDTKKDEEAFLNYLSVQESSSKL